MKITLRPLTAALLATALASGLAAPQARAADTVWKVKSGTGAVDSGRCLSNILLFSQLSEATLKEKTPEYDNMAKAWVGYIADRDEAFTDVATTEMVATATRYEKIETAEKMLAEVVGDLAGCLNYMEG
jgi:hypothetical protein